jgi:hypothetical protein
MKDVSVVLAHGAWADDIIRDAIRSVTVAEARL